MYDKNLGRIIAPWEDATICCPLWFLTKPTYFPEVFYTRKNAQVVTNLQQGCSNAVPTTCQQDVFALLVPSLLTSCQRLVGNLLQGC
jgi:hypothetical protein